MTRRLCSNTRTHSVVSAVRFCKRHVSCTIGLAASLAVTAAQPALAGSVDIKNLQNGAEVSSPVHVEFAVDGMEVLPAKEGLIEGTGHFHVIVDDEDVPEGVGIPFDGNHFHYGKGQMSADLNLDKGAHDIALQFANAVHQSYGLEFNKHVKVTCK